MVAAGREVAGREGQRGRGEGLCGLLGGEPLESGEQGDCRGGLEGWPQVRGHGEEATGKLGAAGDKGVPGRDGVSEKVQLHWPRPGPQPQPQPQLLWSSAGVVVA